jgi:hypothetical protein
MSRFFRMDITFQPDQMVPGGRYIVILRPVADVSGVMPPPNENNGEGALGVGANPALAPLAAEASQEGVGAVGTQETFETANPGTGNNTTSRTMPPRNNSVGGKRSKKMTKKAKKSKGTRKLSPYMKFAQEARPKILKENPNMKSDIIGVGRKIGEMWRALSDAEKARY